MDESTVSQTVFDLKADQLTIVNVQTCERKRKRKWKDVPFGVAPLSDEDIHCYSQMDCSDALRRRQ